MPRDLPPNEVCDRGHPSRAALDVAITEELYARLSSLSPTPLLAHDRSELQEG